MRSLHRVALLSALGISACNAFDDAEFRRAVPSERSVTVNAPDRTNGNALSVGDESEYYRVTRHISRDVNGGIKAILGLLKAIVEAPATTRDGDRRIWGPGADDALSPVLYRFVADKTGDGQFDYSLEYRPKDSADEDGNYVALISGSSDVSSGENDGIGDLTLFADAWADVEPGACGSGTLSVHYDTTVEPQTLTVDFENFGETCGGVDGKKALAAATYYYARFADGSGNFEFGALGDIDDGNVQPAVDERLVIRSRWLASGAGRSDVRISGGDMEANHAITEVVASECWDASFQTVFADLEPSIIDPSHADVGDQASCAYAEAEYARAL